jgi:hypothetical protein
MTHEFDARLAKAIRHYAAQGNEGQLENACAAILAASPGDSEALRTLLLLREHRSRREETNMLVQYLRLLSNQLTHVNANLAQPWVAALRADPRHHEPGRLIPFGYKVYSQNDEDGILVEIFRRIGTTSRSFFEFGVQNGLECNTLWWLMQGWRGAWIEGSAESVQAIQQKFGPQLACGQLAIKQAFITAENIDALARELGVPGEIDLLSVDIDGNDYHVFKALTATRARVVVIEYDAKFPPPLRIVPHYEPQFIWRGAGYVGSSLSALEVLFRECGYALVGCNLTGSNAFFVRNNLVGDLFCAPFTAENHHMPPRYQLVTRWSLDAGHMPDFGAYEVGSA